MRLSKYGISIDTDELFKSQELKDAEKMYGAIKGKFDAVRGVITSKADPISKIRNVMKTVDFRVRANSPSGVIGPRSNNAAKRLVGSTHAFNGDIPEELSVLITSKSENASRDDISVVAILQEQINLSTRSHWDTYNPLGERISEHANAIAQIAKKSLVTRLSSRRIWKGTEPIRIRLVLKFEAYNKAYDDVVAPNQRLQKMALPSGDGSLNEYALLTPPGPYPFELSNPKTDGNVIGGIGDNITIFVGKLFTFERVIISEISTTYSNKFDVEGHPVSAETAIDFSTYEIYTKNLLDTAYAGGTTSGRPGSNAVVKV